MGAGALHWVATLRTELTSSAVLACLSLTQPSCACPICRSIALAMSASLGASHRAVSPPSSLSTVGSSTLTEPLAMPR